MTDTTDTTAQAKTVWRKAGQINKKIATGIFDLWTLIDKETGAFVSYNEADPATRYLVVHGRAQARVAAIDEAYARKAKLSGKTIDLPGIESQAITVTAEPEAQAVTEPVAETAEPEAVIEEQSAGLPTLGGWIEDNADQLGVSDKALKGYLSSHNRLLSAALDSSRIDELTTEQIAWAVREAVETSGLKENTCYGATTLGSRLLTIAVDRGLIAENPFQGYRELI